MDYKYISELLHRYFDCDTSPSEERMLRAFFQGNDVPAQWQHYKALFDAQALAAHEGVSPDFAARVSQKAGVQAAVKAQPRVFSLRQALRPLYNAVAVIAIVMLVGHIAQIAFSDGTTPASESMTTAQATDTVAAPAIDNLRAVGDAQPTAIAADTIVPTVTEQSNE